MATENLSSGKKDKDKDKDKDEDKDKDKDKEVTVKHGSLRRNHGWNFVEIDGTPAERGYAYGYLCARDFAEVQLMLQYVIPESFGYEWSQLVEWIEDDFGALVKKEYRESWDELHAIADGCNANGCTTSFAEILAWNLYCSIPYWFSSKAPQPRASDAGNAKEGGGRGGGSRHQRAAWDQRFTKTPEDRCSAFMAVGEDWTSTGDIVCAHNSFTDFVDGQFLNYMVFVRPSAGYMFTMQTSPCWIWSGSDFFVTSAGIIGTETTFGGFWRYEKKHPIAFRIRRAMQFAKSLDEYCEVLLANNGGDYANAWLFGDIHGNEILRLELGLAFHSVERTKNGYFIGFNAPYDDRIRNLEIENSGFYDIRRHQGARMVRLTQLMEKYQGRINLDVARLIIADHYDVYLEKDHHPCSRTVCAHYEMDRREFMSQSDRPKPFAPRGAVDGIVCDSALARRLGCIVRFGSSCGTPFVAAEFVRQHRQYERFAPYLRDRKRQPWTKFLPATFPANQSRVEAHTVTRRHRTIPLSRTSPRSRRSHSRYLRPRTTPISRGRSRGRTRSLTRSHTRSRKFTPSSSIPAS